MKKELTEEEIIEKYNLYLVQDKPLPIDPELKAKMERRKKEFERQDEQNKLDMIHRKALKDGGGKHSISAWMLDKYFGAGDYDCGEASPPQGRDYQTL